MMVGQEVVSTSSLVAILATWLGTPPEKVLAYWQDLRALLLLALPAVITSACQQGMLVTDQIFVGHLGTAELAAASIGNTYFNVFWFFLFGCTTALDTLGSQAYGAGDHSMLLVWSGAMTLFAGVMCIPAAFLLSRGEWVARILLGQPPDVAHMMGRYCTRLIPGLWPLIWGVVLMKHLQVQNVMAVPAAAAVLTFLINIAGNAAMIKMMGFQGSPLATSLSRITQFALLAAAVYIQDRRRQSSARTRLVAGQATDSCTAGLRSTACTVQRSWLEWAQQSTSLSTQLRLGRLALPGGFMVSVEASSFEVTTVLASTLSTVELAAHACQLSIQSFIYVGFPLAMSMAATIRVGNLLGAADPEAARRTSLLANACGSGFMGLCALVLGSARHVVGRIFSNDAAVVAKVAQIAPWGAATMFSDGLNGVAQGVLRGAGKQLYCLAVNVLGFWGAGVSIGSALCFKAGWRLEGLWAGIMMGVTATSVLSVARIAMFDWQRESELAQQATSSGMEPQEQAKHMRLRGEDFDDEEGADQGEGVQLLQLR